MELEAKLTESIAVNMEQLNKQVNELQIELEAANEVRERGGVGGSRPGVHDCVLYAATEVQRRGNSRTPTQALLNW